MTWSNLRPSEATLTSISCPDGSAGHTHCSPTHMTNTLSGSTPYSLAKDIGKVSGILEGPGLRI